MSCKVKFPTEDESMTKTKLNNCNCQKERLEKELQKLHDFINIKMVQQISLHDRMVIRYHKLMEKCKEYGDNFERMRTENCDIKFITQCLIRKAEELIGCNNIEISLNNNNICNNDLKVLEASGKLLIEELIAYKKWVENQFKSKNQEIENVNVDMIEIKDQLAEVNTKLINSVETEIQLKKNVNDIMTADDADRKKREQVEMDLRVLVMQQSTDLIEFKCKHQRIIEQKDLTMNKLVDAAREDKRTATDYIDGLNIDMKTLTTEKDKLMAELNIRNKSQCLLRSRIDELEDLLTVNTKNINEKVCMVTQVPFRDVENTMYSMQLGRGDNYSQSHSQWSTDDSKPCCSQMVDNKQPYRPSQSTDDVMDDDVHPCLISIVNIDYDDHNISSEHCQTEPVNDWHVTDLMRKYNTENNCDV